MEGGGSGFGLAIVEPIRVVLVTVVGSQVEINDDLHLLGKGFESILLEKGVSDRLDGVEVEFRSEMIEDISAWWGVVGPLTER